MHKYEQQKLRSQSQSENSLLSSVSYQKSAGQLFDLNMNSFSILSILSDHIQSLISKGFKSHEYVALLGEKVKETIEISLGIKMTKVLHMLNDKHNFQRGHQQKSQPNHKIPLQNWERYLPTL